jgi:hypothetical protein
MIDAISSSGAASDTTFGNDGRYRSVPRCGYSFLRSLKLAVIASLGRPLQHRQAITFVQLCGSLTVTSSGSPILLRVVVIRSQEGPMSGEARCSCSNRPSSLQGKRVHGQRSPAKGDSQVAPAQAVELIQVRRWRSGGCPVNGRR